MNTNDTVDTRTTEGVFLRDRVDAGVDSGGFGRTG